MKRDVVCPYCNHKQITKTKLNRLTCSNCGKKYNLSSDNNLKDSKVINDDLPITNTDKEELQTEAKRVRLE